MLDRIGLLPWIGTLSLILGQVTCVQAQEATPQAASQSCPMKKLAALEVRITEQGQPLVPVTIAGRDVWMSVGLEQGFMSLFGAAIADWHLPMIRMNNGGRRITFNGKTLIDMVRTDFSLGPQPFTNWPMIIIPADDFPRTPTYDGKPIVGQLGTRFLAAVDAELNLARNTINLFEHTKCGGGAVYWGGDYTAVHLAFDDTGLLHFPMQLEDQEIQTSFDTSERSSRISTEASKKFFGFDEQSPGVQDEFADNGAQTHSYHAMSLTAKGLELKNAKITLWRTELCRPDRSLSHIDGIGCTYYLGMTPFAIGTDLLRQLRVYIATKEKMVYFTRVDPAVRPAAGEPTPAK